MVYFRDRSMVAEQSSTPERPLTVRTGHAQDHLECRVLGKADIRWNLDHVGIAALLDLKQLLISQSDAPAAHLSCVNLDKMIALFAARTARVQESTSIRCNSKRCMG